MSDTPKEFDAWWEKPENAPAIANYSKTPTAPEPPHRERGGSMTEIRIKSYKGNEDRLITIAKALDGVVICSGTDADPNRSMVCILDEDFPAVFKALTLIKNEIIERDTI